MYTSKVYASVAHFVDFYYLEAISADLSRQASSNPELQFKHSFEKLQNDVELYRQDFIEMFAQNIVNYLWAACLGEARHASDMCRGNEIITLEHLDGINRSTVYKMSDQYPVNRENLDVVLAIYRQPWGSGFGGEAWLSIIEAVDMYYTGKLDAASFIDHCADLEHNGGSAFNKYAKDFTGFDSNGCSNLQGFLNYKFKYDILRKKSSSYSRWEVSPKVARLVQRHNMVIEGQVVTTWLSGTLANIAKPEMVYSDKLLTTEILNGKGGSERREYCDYGDHNVRSVRIVKGQAVCETCLSNWFTECDCGHYEKDSLVAVIDNNSHCVRCTENKDYAVCEDCSDAVTDYTEINGNHYCESCKDANFGYCETHDTYYESGEDCETCEAEKPHEVIEEIAWNGKMRATCLDCEETLEEPSELDVTYFKHSHNSHKPLPHPTDKALQLELSLA